MTAVFRDTTESDPRIRSRRSLRRRLAEIQVENEKRRGLKSILLDIDAAIDAAADEHSARCKPLQKELDAIDEQRLSDIVSRRETSAKVADRQRELLEQLNEANVTLEITVEGHKRAKTKVEQQIRGIQKQLGGKTHLSIGNELVRLARQPLLDREFCLKQKLKFVTARAENAKSFVEKATDYLRSASQKNDIINSDYYGERLRVWRVEFSDASKDVAAVQAEQHELRIEMISPEPGELEPSGGDDF